MNLESQSSYSVQANAPSQTDILSVDTKPRTASPIKTMDCCSSPQQCELSFSDLALGTTTMTRTSQKHQPCTTTSCVPLEDSSITATTANSSSCNNHSLSLCDSSSSQRASLQPNEEGDHQRRRRPSLLSLQNASAYASDDGSHVSCSCRRRRYSCNDLHQDDTSPTCLSATRSRGGGEVRNLMGLQRRRSDPVTRRWREQCSKIYKDQLLLLDSCPENQQQQTTSQERRRQRENQQQQSEQE